MSKPLRFGQAKPSSSSIQQMRKQPVAPPVYRPQPTPQVLQRKVAAGQPIAGQAKPTPAAPPVYRPHIPKVLQRKIDTKQYPGGDHTSPTLQAPPVYRPQPVPKVLQLKKAGIQPPLADQATSHPLSPPVYNPRRNIIVQPKMSAAQPQKMLAGAPLRSQQTASRPLHPNLQKHGAPGPEAVGGSHPNQFIAARSHVVQRMLVEKSEETAEVQSIGEIILDIAKRLRITKEEVLSIVADQDLTQEVEDAKNSSGGLRQWKKDKQLSLKKWQTWTSCFATAERLYKLLETDTTAEGGSQGGNEIYLRSTMTFLCEQIKKAAISPIGHIFSIQIGASDHAFTIFVRGGRCEVVQSFAGESGESLGMNIKRGQANIFTADQLCPHLINMCKAQEGRKASSIALFDGEIMLSPKGADLWPTLSLRWQMSPLPQDQQIIELFHDKMKSNLMILRKEFSSLF
jgi:hypothetical protein